MKSILQIADLRFSYDQIPLLNGLSLDVEQGSITALVGPNGAGKSTLMHCITNLLRPLSGDVFVAGQSILSHPNAGRQLIGYLPDNFGLYDNLTAHQHLRFVAAAYRCHDDDVATTASTVGLTEWLHKYPDTLSRGQRQRLGIAMAILHKPPLILLDEPASGLDPSARLGLSQLLKQLQQNGTTIIVSSHILTELREYASHYIILKKGAVEQQGELAQANTWHVRFSPHVDYVQQVLQQLDETTTVSHAYESNNAVLFQLAPASNSDGSDILRQLVMAGVPVIEFTHHQLDIQNMYHQPMQL